jgi:RNA polymerase sigma factor (sigma-70 family)
LRIIALRALGDPDAADEAVQETLARAVIAIESGRIADATKLAAYVAGIARHVCSHIHRDRKDTVPLENAENIDLANGDANREHRRDALDALITADETERLRVAFAALSATDQTLLRLCFHEDRSPAEVAAALNEPPERVRKRKSRALEKLRRVFLGDNAGHAPQPSGTNKLAPIAATDTENGNDNG